MNIFQKAYDKIRLAKTPKWLKYLLKNVVEPILKGIGEYVIRDVKQAIISAAGHEDWSNDDKFNFVFDRIKGMYKDIGDNALGIAIKVTLEDLKRLGHI